MISVKKELSFEDLKKECWSGAVDTLQKIEEEGKEDELMELLRNPRTNSSDVMAIAQKIAPFPELHGILLDAIAKLGLADLYPIATHALADIKNVYLEPEVGIFKIITEIRKCL